MNLYYLLALKYDKKTKSSETTLRTFNSLENMYLHLEKTYIEELKSTSIFNVFNRFEFMMVYNKGELKSTSIFDVFNRHDFIMMYNKGGVIVDNNLTLYFKSGNLGSDINFGHRGHKVLSFIENSEVNYIPVTHTKLEEDNETKTCIYSDIDLDGKSIICGQNVQDKGYCKNHLQHFDKINGKVEEGGKWVSILKVKSTSIDYYIAEDRKLLVNEYGIVLGKCKSNKIVKLDEDDIKYIDKKLDMTYDAESEEAKKLLNCKL